MSRSPRSKTSVFAKLFAIVLAITIVVYLLRGLGILSFMPGGIILLLILLSIVTGTIYAIQKTRRF